jgi:hypothetical protein
LVQSYNERNPSFLLPHFEFLASLKSIGAVAQHSQQATTRQTTTSMLFKTKGNSKNTASDILEEGQDDVKSSWPL